MTYSGNDFYCDVALTNTAALKIEYESDHVLAFRHTNPFWAVHIVVVPKKHIPSFTHREDADESIIREVLDVVRKIALKVEAETGAARILTNCGDYQDSKHLHIHVSSGAALR